LRLFHVIETNPAHSVRGPRYTVKKGKTPVLTVEEAYALPRENGSGMAPTRYQYREYKNWRGVPKPRRCPFCKQAKGEIRRKRGGFLGVCPNCDASGPKQETYDHALQAWNGRVK
jgi:hypothetical protein